MTDAFADSGYWIAALNPNDQWHERAALITRQLGNRRIVTSHLVIVEFMNGLARRGSYGRRLAVDMARRILNSPDTTVATLADFPLALAIDRYAGRPDQRWGLVDCHSFLIMETMGITEALAYDRDFVQAGFRALLRDD